MLIKIDNREKDLIEVIKKNISSIDTFKDIGIEISALPLGDVIINDGEKDVVIFERKTIRDLAASIRDGRYTEQSYRLNGSNIHNHNVIYLIEGDIAKFSSFNNSITKAAIYSSLSSILLFKGFSVLRSQYLEESAFIICNCAYKIKKSLGESKRLYYLNSIDTETVIKTHSNNEESEDISQENSEMNAQFTDKSYVHVIKKTKKENITPENIGEIMLCQIPSVSIVTALAVMKKFKSFNHLVMEINANEKCLDDICYLDNKNKSRKIGKNCIKSIFLFLKNNNIN
jgi:ERCC4-type nuclease